MKRAVCPGSFDPITFGHLDIIERASGQSFSKHLTDVKGKPIPVFALENRRAAILNALAVGNCQKFYAEVRAAYGAK